VDDDSDDVAEYTHFAGLPVVDFRERGADPGTDGPVAWHLQIAIEDEFGMSLPMVDGEFTALFEAFLEAVPAGSVEALVVSCWGFPGEHRPPVALLSAAANRLAGLRALHIGDTYICFLDNPTDPARLLAAFPRLEVLSLCGIPDPGEWRVPLRHEALRRLVVKTAGLPRAVARSVGASHLPALEELELWLGVRREYGGTTSVADLISILSGKRWPRLRHLGLRNSERADEVAAALASAPVMARLRSLDLSFGTLGDAGAEALLAGSVSYLERLDLHHHFVSATVQSRLREALPGRVNLNGWQDETRTGGRYTRMRLEESAFHGPW
jgi:hypothetical protein